MVEVTKEQVAAAAKIGLGAARMAGAVATATGHGLLGGFLRNHHMGRAAINLGRVQFLGGKKMFDEGLRGLKSAQS